MAGTINGCNCKDMSPSFFADLQAHPFIMAGTINGCNCKDMSPSFFADLQAEYGKYFEIERYDLNNRDKNIIKGFNYMPICLLYFGMSSNRKVV
jgi:hypothetical protein